MAQAAQRVTLFDHTGRPAPRILQAADKPSGALTRRTANPQVSQRTDYYSNTQISPGGINSILRAADNGDIRAQQNLYLEMQEKDAHIASVLQTRELALSGLDWQVQPFSEDARDVAIAEFVDDVLSNTLSFDDAIAWLTTAIGNGFAVSEIVWQYGRDGKVRFEGLYGIRPQRFTFWNSYDPRLITEADPLYGEDLKPNKFIVHVGRSRSGLTNRAGVLRTLVIYYMFKGFSLKDWSIYSEVFGMPIRLGKYPTNATEEDIQILKDAIAYLGSDAAAVVNDGMMIDLVETKRTGDGAVYENFLTYLDNQASKCVLGQTLTTDIGDTGSRAAAQVHDLVRQDLLEDDAKQLSQTLRTQLVRPLVQFNFGPDANIPWFRYNTEAEPDLAQEAIKDKTIFVDMRLPVSLDHLYEKYRVPKPKPKDELLEIPSAPAPGFGFPPGFPAAGNGLEPEDEDAAMKQQGDVFTFRSVMLSDRPLSVVQCKQVHDQEIGSSMSRSIILFENYGQNLYNQVHDAGDTDAALRLFDSLKLDSRTVNGFADEMFTFLLNSHVFGQRAVQPSKRIRQFADVGVTMAFDLMPRATVELLQIQAFTVAHISNQQVLNSMQQSLIDAKAAGQGFDQFERQWRTYFDKTGVGAGSPHHLETVYIQNGTTAYQSGKYGALANPALRDQFPVWQYVTMGDDHVRPNHQAMHGKKYPANDPIWNEWFPPNGFRCRCDVEIMTQHEATAQGVDRALPVNPRTNGPVQPDKGFRVTPNVMRNSFEKWAESNVTWNAMPQQYALQAAETLPVSGQMEPSAPEELMAAQTLRSPAEIWGSIVGGQPVLSHIGRFVHGTGGTQGHLNNFYYVVKTSGGVTKSAEKISDISRARQGVYIAKPLRQE